MNGLNGPPFEDGVVSPTERCPEVTDQARLDVAVSQRPGSDRLNRILHVIIARLHNDAIYSGWGVLGGSKRRLTFKFMKGLSRIRMHVLGGLKRPISKLYALYIDTS